MTSSMAQRKQPPSLPFWSQELRQAKNEGRKVRFQLAVETYFTDEDCTVIGHVLKAEKNAIKIKGYDYNAEFWINSDFVVGTEILDD